MCDVQEFCSDECRSIYHKVLWCRNDTSYLLHLQDLNFLCAPSSDRNSTCLDRIVRSTENGATYDYVGSCSPSIFTQLSLNCSEICRSTLMAYKNDCCVINVALVGETAGNRNDGYVISMHDQRLWEHCNVDSPQICPAPSCPTPPVPMATTSIPERARASRHHVNWFILLSTVLLSLN